MIMILVFKISNIYAIKNLQVFLKLSYIPFDYFDKLSKEY